MYDQATLPPHPRELEELISSIGPDMTLKLIEYASGSRIYVPTGVRKSIDTSVLFPILGNDALERLSAAKGGEYLKVPVARTWRVLAYRDRGLSYDEICRAAGCSAATVHRILFEYGRTGKDREGA